MVTGGEEIGGTTAEPNPDQIDPAVPAGFPNENGKVSDPEHTRQWIAITLLGILAGILLALFCSLWAGVLTPGGFRDLASVLIAPIIGLIGSVIGFYFGAKTAAASAKAS